VYQRLYYYKAKDSPEHVEAIFCKRNKSEKNKRNWKKTQVMNRP